MQQHERGHHYPQHQDTASDEIKRYYCGETPGFENGVDGGGVEEVEVGREEEEGEGDVEEGFEVPCWVCCAGGGVLGAGVSLGVCWRCFQRRMWVGGRGGRAV